MIQSIFQKRGKILTLLFIISCIFIFSLVQRYYTRSSNPSAFSYQDSDLLKKFCSQHDNQSSQTPLKLIKENDHLYGSFDSQLKQSDIRLHEDVWDRVPVKGAFYMLVQEHDMYNVRATMRSMEDRFNRHLNGTYPWIFLSNQRLSSEFKHNVRRVATDPHQVYFGMTDLDAWTYPKWIDSDRTEAIMRMEMGRGLKDAHSLSKKQKMRYIYIYIYI